MEELELVQSARQGDTEAFRQLFEVNKRKVFAIAFRYAKNKEDAEDILQETFIKAYQALDKFHTNEGTSFTSWLYRISINTSIDLLRKKNKMEDKFFSTGIQNMRDKISAVLNQLTARQRMIFILRHYQQLSTQEISEYMGCSQGSVKKQLFRAVTAIKDHFKSLIPEKGYEV